MVEKRSLILLGAGGGGVEVLSWLNDIPQESRNWVFEGFLDDNEASALGNPILGPIKNHKVQTEKLYLCTLGNSQLRLEISENLRREGASFLSLIHPTSRVDPTSKLGTGLIIGPYAYIGPQAIIKDFCMVYIRGTVCHHVHLAAGATLFSNAVLTGFVNVDSCGTLGTQATVLQKIHIGANAVIGAGSVVTKDVASNSTVMGIPAKPKLPRLPKIEEIHASSNGVKVILPSIEEALE